MRELVDGDILVTLYLASLLKSLFLCKRYNILLLFALGCWKEVGRDAVTPPKLARDTPVLDVLKPVAVCSNVFGWVELDLALEHWRQSYVGKVLH